MKCREFHQALPEVLESGAGAEEAEHLRSCPECSGLAQDLQAIAKQASLLSASEEPHSRVWERIREAAELEGLVRPVEPVRPAADPPPVWVLPSLGWRSPALATAMVVLLVFAGALLYRNVGPKPGAVSVGVTQAPATTPAIDAEDQTVLASVQDREPEVRARYERNLKNVNAYIRDAKRNVEANPDDEDARDSLRQAYEQKAMLYEMALSRSMQ
jgi:hypothetical protein